MLSTLVALSVTGIGANACEYAQNDAKNQLEARCKSQNGTLGLISYGSCYIQDDDNYVVFMGIDATANCEIADTPPICSSPNPRDCCEINCGDD